MQYLDGVMFSNQLLTAKSLGRTLQNILPDGILTGCAVTYSGANVSIAPGVVIVCGRIINISATVTEATSATYLDGFGRLKIGINLDNSSTTTVNEQSYTDVDYSATSAFTSLTQEAVNGSGSLYEVEMGRITFASGSISAYTQTLPTVNIVTSLAGKQKTITSGTADPSGGVDGDIYLKIIS